MMTLVHLREWFHCNSRFGVLRLGLCALEFRARVHWPHQDGLQKGEVMPNEGNIDAPAQTPRTAG